MISKFGQRFLEKKAARGDQLIKVFGKTKPGDSLIAKGLTDAIEQVKSKKAYSGPGASKKVIKRVREDRRQTLAPRSEIKGSTRTADAQETADDIAGIAKYLRSKK